MYCTIRLLTALPCTANCLPRCNRQREEKVFLQKKQQEERLRKALERAQTDIKRPVSELAHTLIALQSYLPSATLTVNDALLSAGQEACAALTATHAGGLGRRGGRRYECGARESPVLLYLVLPATNHLASHLRL